LPGSRFRLAAQTPRKRLKFESLRGHEGGIGFGREE